MFTGLIEEVGKVVSIDRAGAGVHLCISCGFPQDDVRLGDSIAVNGVCLTVTGKSAGRYTFDVSPETVERTTFRRLAPGSPVNLERALRLSDRLGGHLVSGHVDCVAVVVERREVSGNLIFAFRILSDYARYLIEKGSVAIDGISLTVNSVSNETFTVNIIPHTAAKTTLLGKFPGNEVNIEADMIGKYVERFLAGSGRGDKAGVSLELLAKSGYL
jgi:riboflavin synthase